MLTIFSVPKPFNGVTNIQQRNAVLSWKQLNPKCEIILCGDDPSVIATADELGVKSLTQIDSSVQGTPLLSDVFNKVYNTASFSIFCYVNADIVLFGDIIKAVERFRLKKYLAVGRRTNLDLDESLEFSDNHWQNKLRERCEMEGDLFTHFGIDYFIFTKSAGLHKLPPFIVGRPRWDNWFIFNARKMGVPVIDITRVCQAIHQNHGYSHIPHWRGRSWNGPEAEFNNQLYKSLIGDYEHHCNIQDATHILTRKYLIPALGRNYLYQRLQTSAMINAKLKPLAKLISYFFRKINSFRESVVR